MKHLSCLDLPSNQETRSNKQISKKNISYRQHDPDHPVASTDKKLNHQQCVCGKNTTEYKKFE